jgi:hypothetical protein
LGRINARKQCLKGEEKEGQEKEEKEQNKKQEEKREEQDEYIKGADKFPLLPGKWGYLPPSIEKMLREVNADCQISKMNTNIKPDHPCLLRHGIEINKNQSFISCISDALFFGKKMMDEKGKPLRILSIKEMKERIAMSLTIDRFIQYQNGNLVTDFYNEKASPDINKYANTRLFSNLNMSKKPDKFYYTKVVSAFENFIRYLHDDTAIIDHTYLWDIVSMPNPLLFKDGVNLVIFQLPNDDITNNVQLLCPTNHYSSQFYEARKPTLFLLKQDGYYEPIYSYLIHDKKLTVTKEFKEYDPRLSANVRTVIQKIVKPFFATVCKPLDSMPNVYKAKRAPLLPDLIQKLNHYGYIVQKYVMNFNSKVIGVLAQDPEGEQGFVPCFPSSTQEENYVFMNDPTLWRPYVETFLFLTKLNRRSAKRKAEADVPCKPAFKIVEDEMVVGILTETNQFIQLSQPIAEF